MSARPRIALPTPTSADLKYNQQCLRPYVTAIEQSGGIAMPIELAVGPAALRQTIAGCDGVVLPGSPADMDPQRYGHAVHPATAAADLAREQVDTALLEDALLHRKPVLGICFGLQSINVWRGGTLVQDLAVMPVPHTAGSAVGIAHAAVVDAGSLLGRLLDPDEAPAAGQRFRRLPVNSSHHQAVGVPGDGLRITARCPQDGVVEAIESDADSFELDVIAVQWHPERSFAISASSRELFRWLVDGAARYMRGRP